MGRWSKEKAKQIKKSAKKRKFYRRNERSKDEFLYEREHKKMIVVN